MQAVQYYSWGSLWNVGDQCLILSAGPSAYVAFLQEPESVFVATNKLN